MKIVGFHAGHDSSYGILEDGIPILHNEIERFNRQKNTKEDSLKYFLDTKENTDFKYLATHRTCGVRGNNYRNSFDRCVGIAENNGGKHFIIGHHQAHAANAFFTSDFEEALIFTIDGGGIDRKDGELILDNGLIDDHKGDNAVITGTTFWYGKKNKLTPLDMITHKKLNLGKDWALCTSNIFGLGTVNDKRGDQAGTVMGMAALGNPDKYISYFENVLTIGLLDGDTDKSNGIDYGFLNKEANISEQNKFDIAASLQKETERIIKSILTPYIEKYKPKNLCLSGGVSLNCVSVGKMLDWFPGINIYCDPIPYDAGLSLGAPRYVYHHVLGNPRIYNNPKNKSSYLGKTYDEKTVRNEIDKVKEKVVIENTDDDFVVDLLTKDNNVISVYGGGSESGRRALGNRSILADPRSTDMKDVINEKVKHRQWFRPFAPSVLRDDVGEWFVHDIDSPYMSFCLKFKEGMGDKVPAVLHFNGTARLQTVAEKDNEWYYNFIKKFKEKTGIPMLLNTSFNDREPIVETPEHAINCFLRTNIDYLYFRDFGILVRKS